MEGDLLDLGLGIEKRDEDPASVPIEAKKELEKSYSAESAPVSTHSLSQRERKRYNMQLAKSLHKSGVISDDTKHSVKELILRDDAQITEALKLAVSGETYPFSSLLADMKSRSASQQRSLNKATSDYSLAVKNFSQLHSRDISESFQKTKSMGTLSSRAKSTGDSKSFEVPHPKAGGYRGRLPSTMHLIEGKLVGHIFLRITSKKVFRKWKIVFFVLSTESLKLYENLSCWEGKIEPLLETPLTSTMFICKPALKRTKSTMDVNLRDVYYTVLKDNVQNFHDSGSFSYEHGHSSNRANFDGVMESRKVCKLGGNHKNEVTALAYAINGVIKSKNGTARVASRRNSSVISRYSR